MEVTVEQGFIEDVGGGDVFIQSNQVSAVGEDVEGSGGGGEELRDKLDGVGFIAIINALVGRIEQVEITEFVGAGGAGEVVELKLSWLS